MYRIGTDLNLAILGGENIKSKSDLVILQLQHTYKCIIIRIWNQSLKFLSFYEIKYFEIMVQKWTLAQNLSAFWIK